MGYGGRGFSLFLGRCWYFQVAIESYRSMNLIRDEFLNAYPVIFRIAQKKGSDF